MPQMGCLYPGGTGALGGTSRVSGSKMWVSCHFVVIPKPFIHQLLPSVEIGTIRRIETFMALSTGENELEPKIGAADLLHDSAVRCSRCWAHSLSSLVNIDSYFPAFFHNLFKAK